MQEVEGELLLEWRKRSRSIRGRGTAGGKTVFVGSSGGFPGLD